MPRGSSNLYKGTVQNRARPSIQEIFLKWGDFYGGKKSETVGIIRRTLNKEAKRREGAGRKAAFDRYGHEDLA